MNKFLFVLFLLLFSVPVFSEDVIISDESIFDSEEFNSLNEAQKEDYLIQVLSDFVQDAPTRQDLEDFKTEAFSSFTLMQNFMIVMFILVLIVNDVLICAFFFYAYGKRWF